ncbi:MAG: hypothetical protein JO060_04240 [Candidatus Eremiobacteraeota bacterium]|nr:hypothetical protein [Candidatus Eremiobacteraeota bacterium]
MFSPTRKSPLVSFFVALVCFSAVAAEVNASPMLPGGLVSVRSLTTASTAHYSVTDLCPLPGDVCGVGRGSGLFFALGGSLNSLGQASGISSNNSALNFATLFNHGQTRDLNSLGAAISYGDAINASGEVAGWESMPSETPHHAFLYTNGRMMNIENASLFPNGSEAYGINKTGQVVGIGFITPGNFHAFLYTGGKMVDLNPFNGFQSIATSINDAGEIIGSSCCSPLAKTWLYANGNFTNLSQTNSGTFINNNGQIVGQNSAQHATLYSNGVWTDLGAFQGNATAANEINNKGQVVGFAFIRSRNHHCPSCPPPDDNRALIFTSGGPVDLNTLIPPSSGFTLTEAIAINDAGQIVADAKNGSDVPHAVLLTPK